MNKSMNLVCAHAKAVGLRDQQNVRARRKTERSERTSNKKNKKKNSEEREQKSVCPFGGFFLTEKWECS